MNIDGKGYWSTMASLHQLISKTIAVGSSEGSSPQSLEMANDLEVALIRHRSTFISFLRNPKKSTTERALLQKAITEAVNLPGFTSPIKLPESFVAETLIISDMYDMSEMAAFSLLKAAEEERTLYPETPRGLVAILFYYDSREHLASACKLLVQARMGLSWTLLPNNEELSSNITRNMAKFLNISFLDRFLELIACMDLTKEIDLLQKNRALGDAKHRHLVIEKFKSIQSLLAETIFCWSAQTPLKREEVRRLLAHLSKVKLTETKDGSLDSVNLTLLVSLLYSIDASYLLNAEDLTESMCQFPITNDNKFLSEIHKDIKGATWESKGLLSVVQFAWSVTLNSLRQLPSNVQIIDKDAIVDEDESVLTEALNSKVFQFIKKNIMTKDLTPMEPFYLQTFHNILCNFIHLMFDRVKLMKNKADENARHIMTNIREGLQAPIILDQPYEDLLEALAALYKCGDCSELIEEFWCESVHATTPMYGQSSRQMALYRFVRLPGDFLPPSLFLHFINFLTSISASPRSAQSTYNFLRMNSQPASHGSNLSWDNFLNAFNQYYRNLRVQLPQSMHDTVYANSHKYCISPEELEGLICVLNLIDVVATNEEAARIALCENVNGSPVYVFTGLLTCNVPLLLKSSLIRVMASFALSPSIASRVWQCIESTSLVPAINGAPGYSNRGIRQDIDEVESVSEEFPLSQAFLDLLLALVKSGVVYQQTNASTGGFKPYFELVKNNIFLVHDSRAYKKMAEKWTLSKKCMIFFHQLLQDYKPSSVAANETWTKPFHLLLLDLVHDSKLLRQILSIFHDGVYILQSFSSVPGKEDLKDTLLYILMILLDAHRLQKHVMTGKNSGDVLVMGIDRLLMTMNLRTGNCDHMKNVALILAHQSSMPKHAAFACQIISILAATESGQAHILPLLTARPFSVSFRQNFVQLLDHCNLDKEHSLAAKNALDLLKTSLQMPAPNLAHFLLGFMDSNVACNSELRNDILEPGVRGFPRTAIHAIISTLPSLNPELCESCHSLLMALAVHHTTSSATLRYLSSHDFVHQSLVNMNLSINESVARLMSTGWILRIAALDLQYHSAHNQKSHLKRLINLAVTGNDTDSENNIQQSNEMMGWGGGSSSQGGRGIIVSLLEICELGRDSSIQMSETKYMNELQDSDMAELDQYKLAAKQNDEVLRARKHFIESWRQLVEVLVSVLPAELSEQPIHQAFMHTITLELTRRLLDDASAPELCASLTSTLLLLVANLYSLHTHNLMQTRMSDNQINEFTTQLPSSLQLILRGIVECMVKFKQSSQNVRAYLYAALLNYLRIAASSKDTTERLKMPQRETMTEQFHRENFECLREDLPQLVDILSCEATAGHVICQLLSLSCLDALVALERRSAPMSSYSMNDSPLLCHLSDQGHLKRIIDGIQTDDKNLVVTVNDGGGDMRPLYLWEARSSFLARLSLAPGGARILLQSAMLVKISEMSIFKVDPVQVPSGLYNDSTQDGSCLNTIYDGAVSGAVRICMAVLTSLGRNDDSAVSQVMFFLSANVESISETLRVPKSALLRILEQISLLTSVISLASPNALFSDIRDPTALQTASQTRRLRRHLAALLPHFLPQGKLAITIDELPDVDDDETCVKECARTSLLNIFTNCLAHSRDILLQDDSRGSGVILMFHPTMEWRESTKSSRMPSIGMLMNALSQAGEEFNKARIKKDQIKEHLEGIDIAHFDFIKNLVSSSLLSTTSPSAIRKMAAIHLNEIYEQHVKQEELASHAVESCVFLLLRHLQYYLKSPGALEYSLYGGDPSEGSVCQLTETQMQELKVKARTSFEEMLPHISMIQQQSSTCLSHVPFLESYLTRIRWILT